MKVNYKFEVGSKVSVKIAGVSAQATILDRDCPAEDESPYYKIDVGSFEGLDEHRNSDTGDLWCCEFEIVG